MQVIAEEQLGICRWQAKYMCFLMKNNPWSITKLFPSYTIIFFFPVDSLPVEININKRLFINYLRAVNVTGTHILLQNDLICYLILKVYMQPINNLNDKIFQVICMEIWRHYFL